MSGRKRPCVCQPVHVLRSSVTPFISSKAASEAHLDFTAISLPQRFLFVSRFDWDPNLHTTHSRSWIEFLGVPLEEVRCASGSASDLKTGFREPLVDGIQRFIELRNMFAVRENSILLCRDGRDAEFAGKT